VRLVIPNYLRRISNKSSTPHPFAQTPRNARQTPVWRVIMCGGAVLSSTMTWAVTKSRPQARQAGCPVPGERSTDETTVRARPTGCRS